MPDTTAHDRFAIEERGLPAALTLGGYNEQEWYYISILQMDNNPCTERQRKATAQDKGYATWRGMLICDEYPFNGTTQGGALNFARGRVSLRFVPIAEGRVQKNKLDEFYDLCGIETVDRSPVHSLFGVAPKADGDQSATDHVCNR